VWVSKGADIAARRAWNGRLVEFGGATFADVDGRGELIWLLLLELLRVVFCLERLLLLLWDLMMAVLGLLREGESCRVMVAVAVGWVLVLAQSIRG